MNLDLLQYIQSYHGTYTREAITQQLLAAGHSPADVEAAWQALETGAIADRGGPGGLHNSLAPDPTDLPARRPRVISSGLFWLIFFGVIGASYAIAAGATYLVTVLNGAFTGTSGSPFPWLASYGLCGIVHLAALIAGILLVHRNRPVALGLLYVLLIADIVLPFITAIIVLGICVVGLSSFFSSNP